MKVAIMQPYVFPYIGYFQLINAADKFVYYDDVRFIKQGWINRNRILINNNPFYFSINLQDQSSNKNINETFIDNQKFSFWKKKFQKSLELNYSKAPFFKETYSLIVDTFGTDSEISISKLAIESVNNVCGYLNISRVLKISSRDYKNQQLTGEARVIDICIKENASVYLNPIGGLELYSKEKFSEKGIDLKFVQPNLVPYKQFNNIFTPGLSIIDVLMFNSKEQTSELIEKYKLV